MRLALTLEPLPRLDQTPAARDTRTCAASAAEVVHAVHAHPVVAVHTATVVNVFFTGRSIVSCGTNKTNHVPFHLKKKTLPVNASRQNTARVEDSFGLTVLALAAEAVDLVDARPAVFARRVDAVVHVHVTALPREA